MINIYDSTGNVMLSPLTGSDAERVEELMSQDYAQLAWQSDSGTILPAGSYIMLGGEKLTLLDPYEPEQKDEVEWSYRPKFQSRVMGWGKVPFFHYTYGEGNAVSAREPDWTLTDTPANFMASVCKAIKNETGETWTYEIAGDIITTTITLSFSSADILSGLGQIAGGYDTEWRADKSTNTLYLGKAQHGRAVTLQVDSNVGVPSVTRNKEGYYNRFYVFGSTRNITQDYQGANVNGLVNKRLTLDPAVYPGGYIDIPRASGTPIFPKILTFDDIYPHSGLTVADLRPRLMYRLDTDGNKVQVGTDSSGNAIYDMYTIWYFQLPGFDLKDSTYSKDNPTGMLISGKALSVHFKSGALTGREFELIYHPKAENLHNSDGQDFYVKAGDYEIKFIEENGLIIPMQTGIVPATGDEVILFNIRMPQEYVATAYTELKEAALKEISDRYTSDLNNYTIKSNPVAFADSDPGLSIGQKVLYVNGDYSYETRVIKLVRKLDIPSEQEITIGSEKVKGNSETLKEEVVNANSNIDILTQLNQLTQNVVQAYQRTQQLMLDGLGKLGRMWEFDPDDPNVIYTKYNFYGKGWGSVLGKNPNAGTIVAGATTLGGLNNVTELADSVTAADKVLIRRAGEAQWTLTNLSDIVGLDTTALATYLANNHYAKISDIPSLAEYATRTWVQQQGYLTEHQSLVDYLKKTEAASLYQPVGDYALTSALNSAVSSLNTAIGKKLDAATFDDLFVKESDGKGGYRIKAKYALYSNQYLSCLGNNPDAGTVALGATTLGGLNNVVAAADEATAAAKVLVREAGAASWTLKNLSDIVGLDTSALATYLSNNGYAKTSDIPSLTGYATQDWVKAQGYLTEHQSLADYATKVWVEGKGYLTGHQSLTHLLRVDGTNGTHAGVSELIGKLSDATADVLDATKFVTSDNGGDATSKLYHRRPATALWNYIKGKADGVYQPKGDYALTSALNSAVSTLNTAIGKKLDAATFDDLFVKESDGNGGYRIRAKYAFYSNLYISCLGNNPGAGTSPGGGVDLDAVQEYLTQQGYATQDWVQQQGYVTALGVSGNYLTWTKNGTVNNITVPFAIVCSQMSTGGGKIDANTLGLGSKLAFFAEIDNTSSNVPVTAGWQNSLIYIGLHSNGSAAQLYFSAGNNMFFRPSKTGAWRTILDSENYAGVLNGKYVTVDTEQEIPGKKTFTATETAVNRRLYVNGSFDTFDSYPQFMWHVASTRWTKAVMDTNGHIHFVDGGASGFASYKSIKALAYVVAGGTSSQFLKADGSVDSNTYLTAHQSLDYINNLGRLTAVSGTTTMPWGLRLYQVYDNGYPVAYGNLLRIGGGGSGELLCGWTGSTAVGELYYRSKRDVAATEWSGWTRIVTSSNYSSVLDGRYVRSSYTRELVWEWGGTTPTHVWGAKGGDSSKAYVFSGENIRNFANAVCRAGDTMTGALIFSTANGTNGITGADNTYGAYLQYGSDYINIRNGELWKNNATRYWHAGNDGSGSGLDADLLDGLHAASFMGIASATWTNGETVVAWAKRLGWSKPTIYGESNWGWTYAKALTVGSYSIDSQRYAALDFRAGNLNEAWKQKAIMFLPTHSDADVIYIAQMTCSGTAGEVTLNAVRRYATYDTILASNVASATKLQTARKIYGVDFDGTGNVNGAFLWNEGDATLRIYALVSAVNSAYGRETIGIQSCFDGQDPQSSAYVTSYPDRCLIALQPRGGRVAIGKTSAAYALDVNGEILTNGWIRTSGAVGWLNQTYGGGWFMGNSVWISAYNKPVNIAYTTTEGANSFGVGLRCYHASHTSVEVQGGSYTMGLGCHSNGTWYWWRGTSSGKGYVMQYDGTTWNFTGVLKTSTGMYSDGYMSCLGQNTGSDMRLKHIIGDVTLSLDMIADAPAKLFRWRYGEFAGRLAVGSIAQYWQQWLAPVVSKRPDDYLQMDYGVTALTASICLARIVRDGLTDHERRILALETENKALKSKINELERRLAA